MAGDEGRRQAAKERAQLRVWHCGPRDVGGAPRSAAAARPFALRVAIAARWSRRSGRVCATGRRALKRGASPFGGPYEVARARRWFCRCRCCSRAMTTAPHAPSSLTQRIASLPLSQFSHPWGRHCDIPDSPVEPGRHDHSRRRAKLAGLLD
jgi:hypothetical protein